MPDALDALRARLAPVMDLRHAAAVLEWDQETFMPPGGAEGRAHAVATLHQLAHERFVDDATGEAADRAADALEGLPPDADGRALVAVVQRDLERARRLPARLVGDLARASAQAKGAWQRARRDDDFAVFAPHLQSLMALSREKADALGHGGRRYDALLDEYEPGASAAEIETTFAALRARLVPLVEAIAAAPPPCTDFLHRPYDEDAQWAFGLDVVRAFGYDMARGRQDRSAHPFTTAFGAGDVRITTRLAPDFFPTAFFGTLHEAGHALYEQGFDARWARTPVADGASLGMHESQSRLWENLIGRSRPFWDRWFGPLQRHFPDALHDVDADAFYRAVNAVQPSLIRVEADEVTYPLHVLLRFELEEAMLAEDLAVADLPGAWRDKMQAYLGLAPETDADGCLQDIHWSLGAIGYFPTYTLGTLMSVQLFEAARRDVPGLDADLAVGDYAGLLGWLREHVHAHGRARTADEILRETTGGGLDAEPWLRYAWDKFGALYGLDRPT